MTASNTIPKKRTPKSAEATNDPMARRAMTPSTRIASIPSREEYLAGYIHREIDKYVDEFMLFDYAMEHHDNVLITGPTGNGKTSAIVAWAADRQLPFYSISSNVGIEPSQMMGKFMFDDTGKPVWQDGPVTDIVRHGGVLLFNEVNFIPDRVSTVTFSLLDKRREIQLMDHKAEVIKAHPDCLFIADMNPNYSGTRPLNAALRNRFSIQLEWDYSTDVESKLIQSTALQAAAKALRSKYGVEHETPVSTNMMFEFERHYRFFGYDFAASNFCNHFGADEQTVVSNVLGTHADDIKRDLVDVERLTPRGDPYVDDQGKEFGRNWTYVYEDAKD